MIFEVISDLVDITNRTTSYPSGGSLLPLHEEGGYNLYIRKVEWGLDWSPFGLFDPNGSFLNGTAQNIYNFDLIQSEPSLTSGIGDLIDSYHREFDFNVRKKS